MTEGNYPKKLSDVPRGRPLITDTKKTDMKNATKKKKATPKPKPRPKTYASDLGTVVAWLRANHKLEDGMATAKVHGAKVGIKVYPRAWGAAFPKKPALRRRKLAVAPATANTHVVIEGNGSAMRIALRNPSLSFDGDTITIREGC